MARKKKRGGSRRAKHRRSSRTLSSNPSGMLKQLPAKGLELGIRAVETVGGVWVARKVRGLAKQQPATIKGSAIELLVAAGVLVAGAFAGPKVARHAENIATGALMAPIMSHLGQLQIPGVSDSLGDDGWVVGPGTGLTLVSAFPDDYAGVAGGEEDLGQWVPPPSAGARSLAGTEWDAAA